MGFKLCDFQCHTCKSSFEYLINWDFLESKPNEHNPRCGKCGRETVRCFAHGFTQTPEPTRFLLFKMEPGTKLHVYQLYEKMLDRQNAVLSGTRMRKVDIEFVANDGDVDVIAVVER